jgi:hypothetical protein
MGWKRRPPRVYIVTATVALLCGLVFVSTGTGWGLAATSVIAPAVGLLVEQALQARARRSKNGLDSK